MEEQELSLEAIRPSAERVIRLARRLFGGARAEIVWRDADRNTPIVLFEGEDDTRFPNRHILKTGEPLWIDDFAVDPVAEGLGLVPPSPAVRCFVGVPVRYRDAVLGVLVIVDRRARPRDDELIDRLTDLAELLADAYGQGKIAAERERSADLLKAALEETARSEQRLQLAAELANVFVWELDHTRQEMRRDGAPSDISPRPYQPDERSLWERVHPDDRPEAEALWSQHMAGGPPFHTTYRGLMPDGAFMWVESAAEAIRAPDGSVARIVGAIRNIDQERKSALELIEARNAAEAADAAKSIFLATISHEIRTPLNGILGMAQAMTFEELPPAQEQRLNIICQSGESLLAIVNDVLDLSKIAAGRLNLESIEFDLVELTAAAHATFGAVATGKGLSFDLSTTGAGGIYRGDPVRIRQILYNLISNGLKFTEEGGVAVTLRRASDGLQIEVADTGIGIPSDRQQSLFQPFVQADTSTTRRYGGTGLGLSICRELAVQMGGDIGVESVLGKGSKFTARLPLPFVGPSSVTASKAGPSSIEEHQSRPEVRILAAEDNKTNQLVLTALLGQIGIEPLMVDNGKLAVEAWRTQVWDVILMDAQMPEMDGVQATLMIRAEEVATGRARTPIIALTANALAHQAVEYTSCGMDGIVAKPIRIAQLFGAIECALQSERLTS